METQLLKAFVTAAENDSYAQTGEILGLTQSAVSKRIAQLEKELGTPLFDQIGRNRVLNEAGHELLPRAQQLLRQIDDTRQFMQDRSGRINGELRIATSHHIGIHRLPEALQRYTQNYPEVHFKLHFIDSEQAADAILHGDYDLALITLSDEILQNKNDNLQFHSIWRDPMHFVCKSGHPVTKEKKITLEKLAHYPAILPDLNTQTTRLVSTLFQEKNINLNITMNTNHLDAIKMMVSVGLGWSVLPTTLIGEQLQRIDPGEKPLERELGCIYHRQRTLSNAARAMVKMLRG